MVSSRSSFPPICPTFHPRNLRNFALEIINFRPQNRVPRVHPRIWSPDIRPVAPDICPPGHQACDPNIRLLERIFARGSGHQVPEIRPEPRMSDPWDFSLPRFTVLCITSTSGVRFLRSLACFVAIDILHPTKILKPSFSIIKFFDF